MTRRFPLVLAALAVLAVSGCGPSVPPDLGVTSVALNLVLGKPPATAQQAPQAPIPLVIPAPGTNVTGGAYSVGPTFGGFTIVPPPPAFVCAPADPAKGSVEATDEVHNAPADGAYLFRVDPGSTYSQNGGADEKFSSPVIATVNGAGPLTGPANPQSWPDEWTYGETQLVGGVRYDTAYQSQSIASNPGTNQAGQATSQLAMSLFQIELPGNITFTFSAPAGHPLDILKTPANASLVGQPTVQTSPSPGYGFSGTPPAWQDAATDPVTGAAMTINAAVTSPTPVQVNACGQNIDTYPVTATLTFTAPPPANGPAGFTGPTNLQWTLHYNVATGMGGLIVHEDGQTSCTAQPPKNPCELDGQPFSESFGFTVDSATPLAAT